MRVLGTLGGKGSYAYAINDRGEVVGESETKSGLWKAFRWANGRMIDLGTLGGPESAAFDLNERGQVVGSSHFDRADWDPNSGDALPWDHAFLWQNGRMRDLGTLGPTESAASGINEGGQVVGWFLGKKEPFDDAPSYGFVWAKGRTSALAAGASRSTAFDISDSGQIVGSSLIVTLKYRPQHAVLWTPKRG